MAQGSALSRWTDRQVLKQVRFRLQFDDPRIPREARIALTGDRQTLEQLSQVVTDYVQTMLQPSASIALGASNRAAHGTVALAPTPTAIALMPDGLLRHHLILGPLATELSGEQITLSVLQLADLATALDAYRNDALALPQLARRSSLLGQPLWRVAAIAVFVTGTTVSALQFLPPQTTTESVSESDAASSTEMPLEGDRPRDRAPRNRRNESESAMESAAGTDAEKDQPGRTPRNRSTDRRDEPVEPEVESTPRSRPQPTPAVPTDPTPLGEPAPDAPSSLEVTPGTQGSAPEGMDSSNLESLGLEDFSTTQRDRPVSRIPPGTAFDRLPQVAEVREYFQQAWDPPEDLGQSLEYRLVIDADGALQAVTPLGQAARDYLDRTAMPGAGQPFVSPTPGQSLQIRLLLSPNGTVQTFLEGSN
jgi:hypothetical protein